MTPEERSQRARIAALERWGRVSDRTAATAAGRRGRRAKLERLADPRGVMTSEQRAKAADALEQAHMERMSYRSRRVRGTRIRATNDGESVEQLKSSMARRRRRTA